MAFPQFYVGWDYGNSMSAAVFYFESHRFGSVTFPSIAAPGSSRRLEEIRTSANLPMFGEGDYLLQFDGREIYQGNLAFESTDASAARGDVTRYWSTRSLEALLVASASVIPAENYELFVVTGLPVETYSKEHRKAVRNALSGDWGFFLNAKPKRAIIHVTQVIMEGAGALIAYGEQGEEIPQGAIDIGGRTTDLFATKGQRPRLDYCKGKPIGVENAGLLVQQMVSENLAGHTLEQEDLYRVLRASVNTGSLYAYPVLFAHGKQIPTYRLMDWTERAYRQIGSDIASFVSSAWRGNEKGHIASGFAKIVLVGGGAYYFHKYINALIPHVYVPQEPELANALGYGSLALSVGAIPAIRVIA